MSHKHVWIGGKTTNHQDSSIQNLVDLRKSVAVNLIAINNNIIYLKARCTTVMSVYEDEAVSTIEAIRSTFTTKIDNLIAASVVAEENIAIYSELIETIFNKISPPAKLH